MNNKHNFSAEYEKKKEAMINALESECAIPATVKTPRRNLTLKIIAVAAALAVLSVGVFAMSQFIDFTAEQDGHEVRVKASISDKDKENSAEVEVRLRLAWRAEDGEISVHLNFGYMPDDITENPTTPYKYSNGEFTRAITFSGYDLWRSDLETIIGGATAMEEFIVGGHKAYLIHGGETDFYNKILYILFDENELVVKASVSYGVTVDELKQIAENMTVSFTDDTSLALPISNEFSESGADIPFVYHSEPNPIYYNELYNVGDTVEHKGYFDTVTTKITLESVEYFDDISCLNKDSIIRENLLSKFTDESGYLIPYTRTEIIRGDGVNTLNSYGKSEQVKKKLIVLTLTIEGKTYEDACPFLNAFDLNGMRITENSEVDSILDLGWYVYDSTPGTTTGTHSPIYREYLGNNQWKLAYILDEEECAGDLWWHVSKNAIGENIGYIIK